MKQRFQAIVTIFVLCMLLASSCAQNIEFPPSATKTHPSTSSSLLVSPTPTAAVPLTRLATSPPDLRNTSTVNVATREPQDQFVLQNILVETTHPMTVVHAIEWQTSSLTLKYALGYGQAEEPKDWLWQQYDLDTGVKSPLSAPVSYVSDAVRTELDLCVEPDRSCWSTSNLFESPSGTQMVYGPVGSQGFETGSGELWLANTDGSNNRLVHDFLPGNVEWSLPEDHLLVNAAWSEWPDAFLIDVADNLTVNRLLDLVTLENCRILHASPHFSPDGTKIAFVGRQLTDEVEDCYLWQVNVDGTNIRKLSEHAGAVQWGRDSQILYVLEYHHISLDEHRLTLYRINTKYELPQVELLADTLPYYGFPSSLQWAVSPDETMIAYTDACGVETLGVVRFAPIP